MSGEPLNQHVDVEKSSTTTGGALSMVSAQQPVPSSAPPPARKSVLYERLRSLLHRRFWGLWAIILITGLLGALVVLFNSKIIPALKIFLEQITVLGIGGYAIMVSIQILTCIPPVPAFSIILLANGFAFGFPLAMVPIYIGSVIGGMIAFLLGRYLVLPHFKPNLLKAVPELNAIDKAIASGNFKVALIIRLAPYAYGLMNFLFASTNITFAQFLLITLIANCKYIIHAYVGGYLRSLTLGYSDPVQIAALSCMIVFGAAVGIFLFFYVRRVLATYSAPEAEEVEIVEIVEIRKEDAHEHVGAQVERDIVSSPNEPSSSSVTISEGPPPSNSVQKEIITSASTSSVA
ncbi:hypothetical protein BJ742DRAFT_825064 [Cladochytrium replicatum]|nr:hypothetical protein BJ742DRAFT_825064 [Cladochytrium replicatum]